MIFIRESLLLKAYLMVCFKKVHSSSSQERGNVLFLILIAVALFAALSFAITQSTRSGGGDAGKEKTQMLVDQLSQYSSSLAQAVTRVILSNGCTIENVNFVSPRWNVDEYDLGALAPSNGKCNIFEQMGGGVIWQSPPFEALPVANGQYAITGNIAIKDVGTASSELVMAVEVTKAVCIRANEQDSAVNPLGEPPIAAAGANFPTPITAAKAFGPDNITGLSNRFPADIVIGDTDAPELKSHQMGCYEAGAASGTYVFYQVIVPK